MELFSWIILGLVSGWIASMVMKRPNGILTDIILGIVGAVIGGFVMSFFGEPGVSGFNVYSVIVAFFGAVIVIWAGRSWGSRTY